MAITAATRAKVALRATTSLEPEAALDIIKAATSEVRGGGKSLLTSGVANLGATIHVEAEQPNRLELSVTSGKRVLELCTFSAEATPANDQTTVRIGGLERFKTSQPRVFGFIPSGPKSILGYDPYRRFLDAAAQGLKRDDPGAQVTIAEPAG